MVPTENRPKIRKINRYFIDELIMVRLLPLIMMISLIIKIKSKVARPKSNL